MKYVRVMDGIKSNAGGFNYKLDEVNISNNWNKDESNPELMGGFNFSTEDKILRWLHRGDTIYDVYIPEDSDIVLCDDEKGIYRSNKIIVSNPRLITDELVIDLVNKSKLSNKVLAQCLITLFWKNRINISKYIIKNKVNKNNVDEFIKEFIKYADDKLDSYKEIYNILLDIKNNKLLKDNTIKYVRLMDKDISNQSGLKFNINEVTESSEWDSNAKTLDTIKGINFSTYESIIRWIRRGDTLYEVEIPKDGEVIKCPGTFTPNGIFRANKVIVKNPVPLTEDLVMDLYKKSDIPERTYHDVLALLAIRKFEKVCNQLIKDRINKDNIDIYIKDYIDFENDIKDNNYGLYNKYKDILLELKKKLK